MLAQIPTLDTLLGAYAGALGHDFEAYRNHAYRVANLCLAQSSRDEVQVEKIAIAAAFHDLGIWTEGTFDYLRPSVDLARAHLAASGRRAWTPEIAEMILQHHKVSRYRANPGWLVESFRRADWADVSRGLVTFGLSRAAVREALSAWPSAGFHKRLVQLELRRLRTHPWHPLPMVKL
jgi:predicted metal-dependent HD superfamily phosphohydrolase